MTIEDPIEFIHEDVKSVIDQREVGIDTRSFPSALRFVMRQDPDIILIGEMRDKESFMAMLTAADVGRLSLATLHTSNAAQVVLRVMDFFPAAEREQARLQLAANLGAVICQRLLPRADGAGSVPAVEVMLGTATVRKLIRENKVEKLSAAIQEGRDQGMQTFNQSLVDLVQSGVITDETAFAYSPNPESLKMNLQDLPRRVPPDPRRRLSRASAPDIRLLSPRPGAPARPGGAPERPKPPGAGRARPTSSVSPPSIRGTMVPCPTILIPSAS